MKNRLVRLTLGAGLALVATAPLTQSASAWYCSPEVEAVCTAYGLACRFVPDTNGKINPHYYLCEQIA